MSSKNNNLIKNKGENNRVEQSHHYIREIMSHLSHSKDACNVSVLGFRATYNYLKFLF